MAKRRRKKNRNSVCCLRNVHQPDTKGNYPAAEALRVVLVQKILRRRRAAGLTQVKLAKLAGIRPETLNRLEQGKHTPSMETINKIDRALVKAGETG